MLPRLTYCWLCMVVFSNCARLLGVDDGGVLLGPFLIPPSPQALVVHLPFQCYLIFLLSGTLETGVFASDPARYSWMLFLFWFFVTSLGALLRIQETSSASTLAFAWVWSRLNLLQRIDTLSGLEGRWLPWILFWFEWIPSGLISPSVGVLVGCVYHVSAFVWPRRFGRELLPTPTFFYKLWPRRSARR
ncbi:hypothetical protein AAG570_013925 [Ranatra chinensis]|uniref:Derlin n=1 Tax=Ranatra chinensis TaxID=642074 RepID=A0ABD0YZW0_9HEMI